VSEAAGAASLVQEGVTGALLDPLDVSSIASAIERSARLEPGSAAVESAAPYAREHEMRRLAALLAEVVRRTGGAPVTG
jgi:hypothetical protein